MLALIHYQGTRLPQRRVELYRLCVEALAETWNLARSLTGQPINLWLGERRLDEQRVVAALAPVAFWLQGERPGGLAGREELAARLADHFERWEGQSQEAADPLAHDFLELVRQQSGLLVERGLNLYGFMHLTFQEYLAARHVAQQADPFVAVKKHLHDARWREVILLTAGILGDFSPARAGEFVQAIRQARSADEDLLHRDLLLAARPLADDVSLPPQVRNGLLDQVLALWREARYDKLRAEAVSLLTDLRGTVGERRVLAALLAALRDRDRDVRDRAASALGRAGAGSAEAVAGLLAALRDEDSDVRERAAEALGQAGAGSAEAVAGLLAALRDEDSDVRVRAADALGALRVATDAVWRALRDGLRREKDWVRDAFFAALWNLAAVRGF